MILLKNNFYTILITLVIWTQTVQAVTPNEQSLEPSTFTYAKIEKLYNEYIKEENRYLATLIHVILKELKHKNPDRTWLLQQAESLESADENIMMTIRQNKRMRYIIRKCNENPKLHP